MSTPQLHPIPTAALYVGGTRVSPFAKMKEAGPGRHVASFTPRAELAVADAVKVRYTADVAFMYPLNAVHVFGRPDTMTCEIGPRLVAITGFGFASA